MLPPLQSKKLSDIHYQHIAEIIDRIKTKPAANHLYTETRVFFNWAIKRRYLIVSPLAGSVQPYPSVSRERVLSHDELRAVWNAAQDIGYRYGTIVQLLMLTGQRRGETSKLKWDYINGDQVTYPSDIVKNKRTHTIPLGPMGVEIVNSIPRLGPMLFPAVGHDDRPFAAWSTAFNRLEALSRCANFTLHDLRRTFATELASLGVAIHVIEKLLNHATGQISGVTAIYNRFSYAKEMREAIDLWEAHLAAILANEKRLLNVCAA
jgi:integrase